MSEKNRAIPNESADPEQYDWDKRIDLQNFVRQVGRDRTGEVAGRENKAEFHRGWHDKQRRECNFHHTEQSKITSDSDSRHLLDNSRIAQELQYAQKRDQQRWNPSRKQVDNHRSSFLFGILLSAGSTSRLLVFLVVAPAPQEQTSSFKRSNRPHQGCPPAA